MPGTYISTVIPTYNRAQMVGRAVESALSQCVTGDEVIVVDDGSTDSTEAALAPYMSHIKYIKLPHSGAGVARNTGVRAARSELVAFLDSDDEWMPGKLELQRAFMRCRRDVLFSFSDFAVRNGAGVEQRHYLFNWHNDKRSWDEILGPGESFSKLVGLLPHRQEDFKFYVGDLYSSELRRNYIFAGTLIVRRLEAGEALHFGEDLSTYEDWECFGYLARQGKAAYLECETAWQISHDGDRLTHADTLSSSTARLTLMERVWGADDEFLRLQGEVYHQTRKQQRLLKIKGLIVNGETREARSELKDIAAAPLKYRLMASIPGPLATSVVRLKRILTGE